MTTVGERRPSPEQVYDFLSREWHEEYQRNPQALEQVDCIQDDPWQLSKVLAMKAREDKLLGQLSFCNDDGEITAACVLEIKLPRDPLGELQGLEAAPQPFISYLLVAPKWRGRGLARLLIRQAVKCLRGDPLWAETLLSTMELFAKEEFLHKTSYEQQQGGFRVYLLRHEGCPPEE